MKIAILGGGNVYALNFADHLHSLGIEHFGIGRRGPKPPGLWQVDHDYRYHVMHLVEHLAEVLAMLDRERPDIVVNFAAQGESAASFGEHTDYFYATNTLGMVRFAEELRKRDYVQRFIQAGTSEVYGSVDRPSLETDALTPTSPYAISKAAFDLHLQVMHRVHGFPVNVLRPSNCYCPGQQLHRIIPRAIICALSGRKLRLQGGGLARKSYMHATDLARAIMTVIEHGAIGETYNCGPQQPVSIRSLVASSISAAGKTWQDVVEEVPARTGEDARYWIDSLKIMELGWAPEISLEHGLEEMVHWVRSYPELLSMDATFKITA
jgi:dTDP-glucose 4,6-dehydratase